MLADISINYREMVSNILKVKDIHLQEKLFRNAIDFVDDVFSGSDDVLSIVNRDVDSLPANLKSILDNFLRMYDC